MKKEILGFNKEKTGEIDLVKELSDENTKSGSFYYKYANENSNSHIGTVFKKNRALVRGGGAKPWRQKHTGRARAGTRRSPIFVGGGVTFGNQRRNYKFRLPRKIKYHGIIALFNLKFKQDLITIISEIKLSDPRVKEFMKLVKNLIDFNKNVILVVKDIDDNLKKATRNIKTIKLLSIKRLVIRDFINNNNIFISKDAVGYLNSLSSKFRKSDKIKNKKDIKMKDSKE